MMIRLIKTPAGSAPEWVRESEVGLEMEALPIPTGEGPLGIGNLEVDLISGESFPSRGGYKVPALIFLSELFCKSPEAAGWFFRSIPLNAIMSGCLFFVFGPDEAIVISREIITRRTGPSTAPRFNVDAGAEHTQIIFIDMETGEKTVIFTRSKFSPEEYTQDPKGEMAEDGYFANFTFPDSQ